MPAMPKNSEDTAAAACLTDNSEKTLQAQTAESVQNAATLTAQSNSISKNQMKKLLKWEKMKEQRKELRLAKKRKLKEQKQEEAKKANLQEALPSEEAADMATTAEAQTAHKPSRKELKRKQTNTPKLGLHAIIDLDFDDLMQITDVAKCVKQCLHIYSCNRRASKPGRLLFTGLRLNGAIHEAFKRNDGYENWDVDYHFDKSYAELYAKEQLVYLTCESDNVLQQIDLDKVYVIGGLVDHNHHKGLCHERATKLGITTARLPLSEYVDMKTRAVLSTVHVYQILTLVVGGKSWTSAIMSILPQRKGAKPKQEDKVGEKPAEELENGETAVNCQTAVKTV